MKLNFLKMIWIMQIVNLENSQPDHGHVSRWYDAADITWIQVLIELVNVSALNGLEQIGLLPL